MTIIKSTESPFLNFLFAISIFFLLGTGALFWAVFIASNLIGAILKESQMFTFEKGGFYLYGVSGVLLAISVGGLFHRVFRFNKDKVERVVTPILFISVAVLFILPQTIHFYIDSYTEKNNYQICRDQSHRWLHVVTIVYAKDGRCSKGS